jgi:hypothetical protein
MQNKGGGQEDGLPFSLETRKKVGVIKNKDSSKDISLINHSGFTFLDDNNVGNLSTSRTDFKGLEKSKLDMNSVMLF